MGQSSVEASADVGQSVFNRLGVPEQGDSFLGVVHKDKFPLCGGLPLFLLRVFRLGTFKAYIVLVPGGISQCVDKSLAGVVAYFMNAPPGIRTFAERETGVTVFVVLVIVGQMRRFGQIGGGFAQFPEAVAGGGRKTEYYCADAGRFAAFVGRVGVFRLVEFGHDDPLQA